MINVFIPDGDVLSRRLQTGQWQPRSTPQRQHLPMSGAGKSD